MKWKVYQASNIDEASLNAKVLERDGKCVLCGRKNQLQVHEILPRSSFGSKTIHLCLTLDNKITLCADCHQMAHTKKVREKILTIKEKEKCEI